MSDGLKDVFGGLCAKDEKDQPDCCYLKVQKPEFVISVICMKVRLTTYIGKSLHA